MDDTVSSTSIPSAAEENSLDYTGLAAGLGVVGGCLIISLFICGTLILRKILKRGKENFSRTYIGYKSPTIDRGLNNQGLEISLVGQGLAGNDPEIGESRTIDLKVMLEPSFNLEDGAKFHLEDGVDLSLDASVSTVLWMDQGLNIHQDIVECPLEEQVLVGELDISTFSMQSLYSTQSDLRLRSLQMTGVHYLDEDSLPGEVYMQEEEIKTAFKDKYSMFPDLEKTSNFSAAENSNSTQPNHSILDPRNRCIVENKMKDQLSISRIETELGANLGSALGSMNNLFKAHHTGLDDEKSCLNPDLKSLSKDTVQLEDSVFSQGDTMLEVEIKRSNSNHSRSKIMLGISSLGDHHAPAPAITSSRSPVLGAHLSEISTVETSSDSTSSVVASPVSSLSPEGSKVSTLSPLSSLVSSSALTSSASCSSAATYSASSSSASTFLVSSSSAVTSAVSSSSTETSSLNSSSVTAPLHALSTTVTDSTSVDNVDFTDYIPVYPIPVGPAQNANSSFLTENTVSNRNAFDVVTEIAEIANSVEVLVKPNATELAKPDASEQDVLAYPVAVATERVVTEAVVLAEPDIEFETEIESMPIGVTEPVVRSKTVQTENNIEIETGFESMPFVVTEPVVGTKTVVGTKLEDTGSFKGSPTETDNLNASTNIQSDPDESHKIEDLRKMFGSDQELPVFKAQSDILKDNYINPDSQVTPKKSGLFSFSVETTFNPFMHTPKPFIPTQYTNQQSPGIRVSLNTGEGFTTPEKSINPEILAKPNLRDSFNSPSFLAAQAKLKYRPFNHRQESASNLLQWDSTFEEIKTEESKLRLVLTPKPKTLFKLPSSTSTPSQSLPSTSKKTEHLGSLNDSAFSKTSGLETSLQWDESCDGLEMSSETVLEQTKEDLQNGY